MEHYQFEEMDLNEVVKNVFIGDRCSARNRKLLRSLGIRYILVAGEELDTPFSEEFTYMHLKIKDSIKEHIHLHFETSYEFIEKAQKSGNGILIHCAYGVSRSATILIAYLIKKLKISYTQAFAFARRKRSVIRPNRGFEEQLKQWSLTFKLSPKPNDFN